MKKFILVLVFASFIGLAQSQTWELNPLNAKDTINKIDSEGKKQGKWVLFGKHKPGTCYAPEAKAEEGKYIDNRKIGIWLEYYCNGKMRNKITFINGRPDGYAIMYHDNGKISEEGNWKNSRWVGNYKLYYDNGQVQHEFVFNLNGKREGAQKYYFDNGQIAIEGNFANGKESGILKEYYENGDIKAEKNFAEGSVDVSSIKEYPPKRPLSQKSDIAEENAPKLIVKPDEKPNEAEKKSNGTFMLNGQQTLYNKNKQITKDGVFKDNRFMSGKAYIYDENGILLRIAMYKDGIYIGDTQSEN